MLNTRLIPRAAKRSEAFVSAILKRTLQQQVREIASAISNGDDPVTAIGKSVIEYAPLLMDRRAALTLQLGVAGWNLAGQIIGRKAYVNSTMLQSKSMPTAAVSLEGADELVAIHLKPRVDRWIDVTSKLETKVSARKYQQIIQKAMRGTLDPETGDLRAPTPRELGRIFQQTGLAHTEARAQLMARTLTNYAYNEGATQQYQDAGVTHGEWVATLDDVTSEWCEEMHGTIVALGDSFVSAGDTFLTADGKTVTAGIDVPHPPLHPNCRCTIVPVI